jgi:hypothetical protein
VTLLGGWYVGIGHGWISKALKGFTRAQAIYLTKTFRQPWGYFYKTHPHAYAIGMARLAYERWRRRKLSTRELIARIALQHVGESHGPFVIDPGEWCADFACWVWQRAGVKGFLMTALAAGEMDWGKPRGLFHYYPQVGDFIHYGRLHVGIVVKIDGNKVQTVEGNFDDHVISRWVPKRPGTVDLRPTYIVGYTSPPGV